MMVIVLGPMSFGPIQLRLADCLIPLAALFGWPVVAGVTLGCFVSNAYYFLGITDVVFGTIANFIASLLVWKIGSGKRVKITVNVLAIIGVAFAFVSFFLPWWFFKAKAVGYELGFNVYPGWFGGNLGSLIEILNEITNEFLQVGVFNRVLNDLGLTLYLVGGGAIVVLVGAFVRGNKGRAIIATGAVLNIIGVYNFYSVWTGNWARTGLAVSGSEELSVLGMQAVEFNWGWVHGISLAVLACIVLVVAIIIPPTVLKLNRFLGCSVAAIVIGVIVGGYLWIYFPPPEVFGLALSAWAAMIISITLSSWIAIGIIGYSLLEVVSRSGLVETPKSEG